MMSLRRDSGRRNGDKARRTPWAVKGPLIFMAVALAGCSGGKSASTAQRVATYKVSGKVMYKGLPIENAHVTFHPRAEQGPGAFGQTNAEGEFTLRTYEDGDGAPAGDYLVTVQKNEAPPAPSKTGDELFRQMEQQAQSGQPPEAPNEPKSLLPEKYSRPQSSGLSKTVTAGDANRFEFELTD